MINLNRGYSEIKELIFKVQEYRKWKMNLRQLQMLRGQKFLSIQDFKKLVEKDRQLAEYLCMNYENLDSEDLGAFVETVEQGFSWILDLIESKDLLYKPKSGSNHAKRK